MVASDPDGLRQKNSAPTSYRTPRSSESALGAPYSKDTPGDDFRAVHEAFSTDDKPQLSDMRRSGAVEGDAGGGSEADQPNTMANSIATNKRLRKTYNPVNVASVRRFDEARGRGQEIRTRTGRKCRDAGHPDAFQKSRGC